ncbi:MAG: L-histidine N(alpha)-methyltransferase [Solirubrobacteraceae bacterium]
MTESASATAPIRIDPALDEGDERRLADDVHDGLTRPFKEIPPKHFYDARGSELFDRICEQPEYYPTRTELAILRERSAEIVSDAAELVELGSGAATKARVLLDAMARRNGSMLRYVPLDVSEVALREAAEALITELPSLHVHGLVADFERHLDRIPPPLEGVPRLVALLGGTIGNFPPGTRQRLLRSIAALLRPGDRFLLGTDLVKDTRIIEAAYNDAAGVTAEFNLNVLRVINRELRGNFDPNAFEHVAFFDRRRRWVEMRLRARRACTVWIEALDLQVEFAAGEELRTEISAKFTPKRLESDLAAAGLELVALLTDPDDLFALSLSARA